MAPDTFDSTKSQISLFSYRTGQVFTYPTIWSLPSAFIGFTDLFIERPCFGEPFDTKLDQKSAKKMSAIQFCVELSGGPFFV